MLTRIAGICILLAALTVKAGTNGPAGRYLEVTDYLADAFPDGAPDSSTLWVDGALRASIETVLGHRFAQLRLRYWYSGDTSTWILEEIGKELPITIGVTICADAIVNVRVLEFRESRGWEVKYPFFTDQFRNARLQDDGNLDRNVDGISGATLSVRAVTRMARVALLLHDNIKHSG